jgi:hypothetical protein
MNYQDVMDYRAFMAVADKLDKMDIFGILDMLNEPPIEVIEYELDLAVNCYHVHRNAYPTYVA